MALTDETIPYEILIRFDLEGQPLGAHVQYRRVIKDDGVYLNDIPQPAQPLALDGEFPVSGLLSETLVAALSQINALQADLAECQAALETPQD